MILVTGGTGLVGSHLVNELSKDHKIIATYNSTKPTNNNSNISWLKLNILDVTEVYKALESITHVYHCAATVSFNPKEKELLFKNNIEGTANIVNACLQHNVKRLVHVSSVAALGRIRKNTAIDETMNWTKETSNSVYGQTKYLAEMEVWRGVAEGLEAVCVNPTIILGNSNWNNGSTAIFKNAYNEFPWYTNGVSGFVDVLDVVQAMILLMNSNINGERYILCGYNLPYKQVFTSIAKAFGKKPPYKQVTPFIAAIVWRIEAIKSFFTKKNPLLTKETAHTAQAIVHFKNNKLIDKFPNFTYTPFENTITRICSELKKRYTLA
jgi:dihydroflavonol-4-reductase